MKDFGIAMVIFCLAGAAQAGGSVVFDCEGDGFKISLIDSVKRSGTTRVLTYSELGGSPHREERPRSENTIMGQVISMSYAPPNADSIERYASLVLVCCFRSHNVTHFWTLK